MLPPKWFSWFPPIKQNLKSDMYIFIPAFTVILFTFWLKVRRVTQSNSFLKDTRVLVLSAGTVGLSHRIVPALSVWLSKCYWLPALPQLVHTLFPTHIFNPVSWRPWCFWICSMSACGCLFVPICTLSPPVGTFYVFANFSQIWKCLRNTKVLHVQGKQSSKYMSLSEVQLSSDTRASTQT